VEDGDSRDIVIKNDKQVHSRNNAKKQGNINSKKIVLLITLVALLGVGSILYSMLHSKSNIKNIAFTINGTNYTKTQVDAAIVYPVSLGSNNKQAAQTLFDIYKDRTVAALHNLVPSTSNIADAKNELSHSFTSNDTTPVAQSWINLIAYDNALKTAIVNGTIAGAAQGYDFNFWFNQHEDYGPANTAVIQGNGDQTLIASDRAYALKSATNYRNMLLNKEISPNQLINDINSDTKLNQGFVVNSNNSVQFGNSTNTSWQNQVGISQIINFINKQTSTGITKIQTGTLSVPKSFKNSGQADSYYYFVQLTKLPSPPINMTQFNNSLKSLDTKYYGI
jgi:hypothetical protein